MNDPRDEKIERWLRSRPMEPASPDLAERIILRARSLPQHRHLPLWQWLRLICSEFHLPKPAYVVAGALTLGAVIGFSLPPAGSSAEDSTINVQSVFSTDEALL